MPEIKARVTAVTIHCSEPRAPKRRCGVCLQLAAAFSTGGLNKPVPCSTKASVKTDNSSEAEDCDSASQSG